LLGRLDIFGAVIIIDAMGCEKNIAEQSVWWGGDCVLSLKGNQGCLLKGVEKFFANAVRAHWFIENNIHWCGMWLSTKIAIARVKVIASAALR
jgi:predicted transposase YbfD/YdcC